VFIHGELWDAVASGTVDAGQVVVVRRIDGLRLEVEPVGSTQPSRAPASI